MFSVLRRSPRPCSDDCPGWYVRHAATGPAIRRCNACWPDETEAPPEALYQITPECVLALDAASSLSATARRFDPLVDGANWCARCQLPFVGMHGTGSGTCSGHQCYACDLAAEGYRDQRPEGGRIMHACARHADPTINVRGEPVSR